VGDIFFRAYAHELTLKGMMSVGRSKFNETIDALIPGEAIEDDFDHA